MEQSIRGKRSNRPRPPTQPYPTFDPVRVLQQQISKYAVWTFVFGQDRAVAIRLEVGSISGQMLLTFQGLTRVVSHVITEFIKRSTKVDAEIYDYRPERAGILQAPWAAKYWVWKTAGLLPISGSKWLEGFLHQAADQFQRNSGPVVSDLRGMLFELEKNVAAI